MIRVLHALMLVVALLLAPVCAHAGVLNIKQITTPKGLTFWFVPDDSLPITTLSFAFHTHAGTQNADKQGALQLLSNMLDEGAGERDSNAFQSALRDNAIDLSFSAGRDSFGGAMRTLSANLPIATALLKDALAAPHFDAAPFKRMQAANIARVRANMGDDSWLAARILYDAMYQAHPYGLNSGGTLSTLAALTPSDLKNLSKSVLTRNNVAIALVGDLKPATAANMVDAAFADLPAGDAPAKLPESKFVAPQKPIFFAKDQPQTQISMAWPGIGVHDPDYYAMRVMDYIFGGGSFSSRLMQTIRKERGYTYGISTSALNLLAANRYILSSAMLPTNVKPALTLIAQMSDQLTKQDVSPDELQAAKDYLTGALPVGLSSSSSIAHLLTSLLFNDRPIDTLDKYVAGINAVSAADIRRVATRIFAATPVVVFVGAKPDGLDVNQITTLPNTQ